MPIHTTDDLRIVAQTELIAPRALIQEYPISPECAATVAGTRKAIGNILRGDDDRLLFIVGPCSIHDTEAAAEYAQKLKALATELAEELLVVMRVYFEKPRTIVGWKGLINDPNLDESFDVNKGLRLARSLLLNITKSGLPCATEYLDLISPQYIADLIAWAAIGARTTESQGHRELASGLSCPVGFKNGTAGSASVALDAIEAAARPHHFLSVTKQGYSAIFGTSGNADCHIVLRGGSSAPNYSQEDVQHVCSLLAERQLPQKIMIDCSHANSGKKHKKQLDVARGVGSQLASGNSAIMGMMAESNLYEGKQKLVSGQKPRYGVSITDACLGWQDTETLLRSVAEGVTQRRRVR